MFERFTDRARRVIVLAQEEARLLQHNYIGTEHLLLGLIHESEGVAARVLDGLGAGSLEDARIQVEEIVGPGQQAPSGHIPFTLRAKKVLEVALREALRLEHNYIGTEHILLALTKSEGVAVQVLDGLGVTDLDKVRANVIRFLRGDGLVEIEPCITITGSGVERLWELSVEVGQDHPDFKLAAARLHEAHARRLRKEARLAVANQNA